MKKQQPITIHKFLVLICLSVLINGYGQKTTQKVLFGKAINKESVNPKNGLIRCATSEYENFLQKNNPKRVSDAQFENWINPLIKHYKSMRTTSQNNAIMTIPVVVHVIHNGQTIGTAPNITDAQVQSQITVLNQDYRKMVGSPGDNSNPVGADVQIEFILALADPNGNPSNGIDRVTTCQASWSETEIDATLKPATIWDPTQYLNMWTVEFSGTSLLGYAQFPEALGLQGLDPSAGNANTDGVVSNYNVFGSNTYNDGTFILDGTYNMGRTMSHEVGHWLGLRHIWGDGACADDFCADTPTHHDANYGCPVVKNCDISGNEMVENYMDYTDDSCMNVFTQNQKDRIVVIMNNAVNRNSLLTSIKKNPITLFANDAEVKLENSCDIGSCGSIAYQTTQRITIYNRGTSNLTSATVNYSINGGNNTEYNWTGDLASNKSDSFDITINSSASGTIDVNIVDANGVIDERTSNNLFSGTFIIPTTPLNYTFTNYVFKLQKDLWGSETTWDLVDGSGNIIKNGGPYKDKSATPLPALITANWALLNNQCYTFSIYDSQGDGICCGTAGGDGYYSIKSTDGLTTIASGTTFGSIQKTTFTTNLLGNKRFETTNEIYLYPNPAKEIVNIKIPSDLGLPNSFTIYNSVGQTIGKKVVSKEMDLSINTSTLSKGVYFITIIKDDSKKTLQFIKE